MVGGATARELAENPDANLDERLQTAEDRANELSEQARNDVEPRHPELASALRDANERLAAAASALRDAKSADDVMQALEEQLSPAADRLSEAAGEAQRITGTDAEGRLEKARDQIERLRDDLPDLGR